MLKKIIGLRPKMTYIPPSNLDFRLSWLSKIVGLRPMTLILSGYQCFFFFFFKVFSRKLCFDFFLDGMTNIRSFVADFKVCDI